MTEYVCGFMFTPERNQVLLLLKDRPLWQAGKYNGLGGKIEEIDRMLPVIMDRPPYSNPVHNAMQREFYEESGIWTGLDDWEVFATLQGKDHRVYCLRAFSEMVHDYRQVESEVPQLLYVPILHEYETVPNVQWLVPMALSTHELFTVNCKTNG